MPELTRAQTSRIMRALEKEVSLPSSKPEMHDVLQSLRDAYETSVRPAFNTAIEDVAPGVFNVPQKKMIARHLLGLLFETEVD